MSNDLYDHYCAAWGGDDSIIPNTIESVSYDRFFIKIETEFIYQVNHDDNEEEEDILESITREKKFEIPCDKLMVPTSSWSTISDMLTTVGIQLDIQPFMIHKISECANELAKGSSSKRSVIPMMVSISVVVGEDEVDLFDDNDNDDARMMPASESAVEALKNLRVEEQKQCMVCLEDTMVGSEAMQMPCSHVYHGDCIVNWLRVRNFCPLCRYQLPTN